MKRESKRVDVLEEGNDIDLSSLAVDGAGIRELYQVITELKTELLMKVGSRDE